MNPNEAFHIGIVILLAIVETPDQAPPAEIQRLPAPRGGARPGGARLSAGHRDGTKGAGLRGNREDGGDHLRRRHAVSARQRHAVGPARSPYDLNYDLVEGPRRILTVEAGGGRILWGRH